MISQKTQLFTRIDDRDHTYQCDPASPLTEVLEALNTFRCYVIGRLKDMEEQQENSQGQDGKEEA